MGTKTTIYFTLKGHSSRVYKTPCCLPTISPDDADSIDDSIEGVVETSRLECSSVGELGRSVEVALGRSKSKLSLCGNGGGMIYNYMGARLSFFEIYTGAQ
jgi:hypothetical protein